MYDIYIQYHKSRYKKNNLKSPKQMVINELGISDHLSFPGDIDGMKNSPANGPGTPPVSMPGYVGDGLSYQDNVSQMNL